MSFGGDCLINKINQQIAALEGSTYESSQLAGSVRSSLEKSYCCVTNISDLPPAACNEGRFIYVTSCKSFRYSDGYEWLMNACSGFGNVNQVNQLWTWGFNQCGVLGDGTTLNRCSPETVAGGGTTWCRVGGAFAIKTDGTLWTWGFNICGRLGDGTTVNRCSPGTIAGGGTTWCQVCFRTAIKCDGTLWTWGSNPFGNLGNGTTLDRCSPGTTWGNYTNWCQVSGLSGPAALKTDGTLWTWGLNASGALGDGTTVGRCSPGTIAGGDTNWRLVSSYYSGAAIKCDGTLWTWGQNASGQLGDGTTINRCSPGTIAGGGTTWCQVSAGLGPCLCNFMSAIKCDGTLWTWGNNCFGKLGDGSTVYRCSPGTVAGGGTTWCQVTSGSQHAIAIKTDGTIWTWGCNSCGMLADGSTFLCSRSSPGTIAGGGTNWCQVSSGPQAALALKSRGF